MMGKLGVQMNEMKSGNLKAVPSPFAPLDEEGRQLTQEMIDESHKWFIDLVAERRNINPAQIPGLIKGRIFSGRQALQYGLVDAVGGEAQALDWLKASKKINKDLPVIDWQQTNTSQPGLFGLASNHIAKLLGIDLSLFTQQFSQDGLMSLVTPKLISKWRQ